MADPDDAAPGATERPSRASRADVIRLLTALGLDPVEVDGGSLSVEVSGEWRRRMPVHLTVEERHLRLEALLTGALDEGREEVYGFLLRRNEGAGDVRFALDGDGDVLLVARLPLVAVDAGALDELFGELITAADESFNRVLGAGFAGYVDREQRWRAGAGMPDNPAFPSQ